jgi:hypothetical protein
MSRAPYAPAPGSVAQRAIAHLEMLPRGADLSTAVLAEAIGVQPNSLKPCLEAPLRAGMLSARQKYTHPRAPFFWSLASDAPVPIPSVPRFVPKKAESLDDALAQIEREKDSCDPAPDAEASGSQTPEGADSEGRAEAGSKTEGRRSQPVVKAEPATADATDREIAAAASPVGGPMGARQPAAAGPAGETLVGVNATLSMSGELVIVAECGTVILFDKQRAQQLLAFLNGRAS